MTAPAETDPAVVQAEIKVLGLAAKVLQRRGMPDLADLVCEAQARIVVDYVASTDRTAPGNRLAGFTDGR